MVAVHRLSKTYSILVQVIYGIKLAKKDIANDPQRAHWFWQVHAHEGRNTRVLDIQDVVFALECVWLIIEIERK